MRKVADISAGMAVHVYGSWDKVVCQIWKLLVFANHYSLCDGDKQHILDVISISG